jgi:endonuclease YncB( thermonuclease family)
MRYIVRLIRRALIRERIWQQPHPQESVQIGDWHKDKKKALSAEVVRGLIEGFPEAKVVHVVDGDTVIVASGWSRAMVRLDSIDCPEDGQHWGDIASYGLIKLIGGRKVHLEEHGLDFHGRMLATIYVRHVNGEEWVNVNERMVVLGHAWVMYKFYDHLPKDRQDKLNRLENWARSKKVGLWRSQSPIPPWQWRNEERV